MKKTFSSSTFGVVGNKWHLAAKATCNTMSSSFAGGTVATLMSYILIDGKFEVLPYIDGDVLPQARQSDISRKKLNNLLKNIG